FGVYGKLGRQKGTYALLEAVKRIKERGFPLGLLVMAQEVSPSHSPFREYVPSSAVNDRVCQLPFLPHGRVPEFIRRCLAICCLEQDFPITFHSPIIAREVLTCGACLIGSAEIIKKLPAPHKLI